MWPAIKRYWTWTFYIITQSVELFVHVQLICSSISQSLVTLLPMWEQCDVHKAQWWAWMSGRGGFAYSVVDSERGRPHWRPVSYFLWMLTFPQVNHGNHLCQTTTVKWLNITMNTVSKLEWYSDLNHESKYICPPELILLIYHLNITFVF